MFDKGFVQQLKQSNISADSEKSAQRLSEVWKSASRAEQSAVLALAGVARASVQRAYKTGSVSAKLVIAVAQTMNLSPVYLTGEEDERGEFDEGAACALLHRKGYNKLLAAHALHADRRELRMTRLDGDAAHAELPPETHGAAGELTEEDLVLLLRSVLLRARAGGHYADLAGRLRLLLLS